MNQSKMDLYAVLGFGGLVIAVVTIAGAVLAKARTVAACAKECAQELQRLRAENARLKPPANENMTLCNCGAYGVLHERGANECQAAR